MGTTSMPVLGDFTQLSFYEEAVELFILVFVCAFACTWYHITS
jgi:hypothetical protein